MDNETIKQVGKKLYKMHILKERKRYWVFRIRVFLHKKAIDDLLDFFNKTKLRQKMLRNTPALLGQTTRAFFYKGSKFTKRVELVKKHIEILEEVATLELLEKIYVKKEEIPIWSSIVDEQKLDAKLFFHAGQRKEGCLSLMMTLDNADLYQIMFWLGVDKKGKRVLYVGAIQGTPNANRTIKKLTKRFFGYRTKNLIFYILRQVARNFGVEYIKAVTNEGYYAMNHLRIDRKLKTNFAKFWSECGGIINGDRRFVEIPVEEYRKDMSELKPSKRSQHRKRFALLDEIAANIDENMAGFLK